MRRTPFREPPVSGDCFRSPWLGISAWAGPEEAAQALSELKARSVPPNGRGTFTLVLLAGPTWQVDAGLPDPAERDDLEKIRSRLGGEILVITLPAR
jgi:hypothetical protein